MSDPRPESRPAPAYDVLPVEVVRTRRLSPTFVRLALGGPALAGFGAAGYDQRLKILLPRPGRPADDLAPGPDWYPRWRAMPERHRPVMRTYTVRAHRPADRELDVDLVLHDGPGCRSGPVSAWAAGARPGDRLAVVGPDRPGSGRLWGAEWAPPPAAGRLILAGDETALPAIAAIVESLPDDRPVLALAEVPDPQDVSDLLTSRPDRIRWLVRSQGRREVSRGVLLEAEVRAALLGRASTGPRFTTDVDRGLEADDDQLLWDVPDEVGGAAADRAYAWLAGEAGVVRALRAVARREAGLPRTSVAAMGYWREGVAEAS